MDSEDKLKSPLKDNINVVSSVSDTNQNKSNENIPPLYRLYPIRWFI